MMKILLIIWSSFLLGSRIIMTPVHQVFRVLFPSQHLVKWHFLDPLSLNGVTWLILANELWVFLPDQRVYSENLQNSPLSFHHGKGQCSMQWSHQPRFQSENGDDPVTQPLHICCIFWRTPPLLWDLLSPPKPSLQSSGHKSHTFFGV